MACSTFLSLRSAAIVVQASTRSFLAVCSFRAALRACVQVQGGVRRLLATRAATRLRRCNAAIRLQASARQHLATRSLSTHRAAAVWLQSATRRLLALRLRAHLVKLITQIQASSRRQLARKLRTRAIAAATVMETASRRRAARRLASKHRLCRQAATTVQRHVRASICRAQLARMHQSATAIATMVRGRAALIQYALSQLAISDIQRCLRGLQARMRCRVQLAELRHIRQMARSLQRAARDFLGGQRVPYRRRILHACAMLNASHSQLTAATTACGALNTACMHPRSRFLAMELRAFPLLVRTATGCNRSPQSMHLLGLILDVLLQLVSDGACREHVTCHTEFTSTMMKVRGTTSSTCSGPAAYPGPMVRGHLWSQERSRPACIADTPARSHETPHTVLEFHAARARLVMCGCTDPHRSLQQRSLLQPRCGLPSRLRDRSAAASGAVDDPE